LAKWLLEDIVRAIESGSTTVAEASRRTGISSGRIYRALHQSESATPEPVRYSDRERYLALACAAVIRRSMSKIKKRAIPTHEALKELVRLAVMEPGELSVSRANRLLVALEISAEHMRKPSPCIRLQTLGPNHVHEADFTHAAFVYLDNLTVRYRSEITRKEFPRRRVMLGVVKDHYSRAILAARAYEARGENTADTLRLLYDAWCPKLGTSGLPHGLPWNLYTDNGKFISKPVKTMLKSLFVTGDPHSPDNPRASGLAENTIKSLTTFQHLLKSRLCRGVSIDLDHLNAWMQEWCVDQNAMEHPEFKGTTRAQVWQQIQDDDIRRCPPWDVFIKLSATRDEPRKVTEYGTVKYDGLQYAVGVEHRGNWVYAYRGPDAAVYVEIPGKGVVGPVRSGVPKVMYGSYSAPPLTKSEIALREVDKVSEELGYVPDDVEYHRRTDEVFIPREGRQIVDDKGESERFYSSVFEAKSALADSVDLASLTDEVLGEIDRTLEDRADACGLIPTTVVDQIAALVAGAR
jgi:hypothetical protein